MTEQPHPRHLYVHVPFCAHRCGYCAFVTAAASEDVHDAYVEALITEHRLRTATETPGYDTVYIGGGTPTLLEEGARERLLEAVEGWARPGAEVTIECNPETVDDSLAQRLAQAPITRVSVGVQSTSRRALRVLERRADPDTVRRAVTDLRNAGVSNLSVDLLWGMPGHDLADIERDLGFIAQLGPEHVSTYELEFKEGTRIAHAHPDVGRVLEDTGDQFEFIVDTLRGSGYRWYEISNFARPGRECRHNLAYWRLEDWEAIGMGAVANHGRARRTNTPGLHRYLDALGSDRLPQSSTEEITRGERLREQLMLAARLDEPLELDSFGSLIDVDAIEHLRTHGLVEPRANSLTVTTRGRMLLNSVLERVIRDEPVDEAVATPDATVGPATTRM